MKGIVSARSIARLVIAIVAGGMIALSSLSPVEAGDRGNWHDGRDRDGGRDRNGRGGFSERTLDQPNLRSENIDRRYYKRHRDRYRNEARRQHHARFENRRDFARRDRHDERRGRYKRYDRYDRDERFDGPSYSPRGGTYAGSISAYRDDGNGVYFDLDRYEGYDRRRSRSQVIIVEPGRNNCSYEAGVCVVRP